MRTSNEILDALSVQLGGASDYRISKALGITSQYVYRVRAGKATLGEGTCVRAAEILEVEPAELVAVVTAERTKCPELRESWRRLLERAGAALVLCLSVGLFGPYASPAAAGAGEYPQPQNIHSAKSPRRRRRKTLHLPGKGS